MQLTPEEKQNTEYEIDKYRGFLLAHDPQINVPKELGDWGEIAVELPKLLIANRVRQAVDQMAAVKIKQLTAKPDIERAMLIFSYIGHAYVWGQAQPPEFIPAQLAVPWHQVASQLGRPPILSYASYALCNWKRIDKNGPVELGNIALIQNFLGGADEEWFVIVHVDIEAKAAPAINAILPAQAAAKDRDFAALEKELGIIDDSLAAMYKTLLRMPEHCDPYIYYHRVRPYIHGWKDHPLFPKGLIYAGVESYKGQPQLFRGETGAQSSIIPALDAVLGVTHDNDRMRHYLDEMRNYMPPAHRAFIQRIEQGPSIRDVVKEASSNKSLCDLYNNCIEWMEKFRTKHLEYARDYIFRQAQLSPTNPSAVGTGGTPFMPYLEKHRDETSHHLIK